MPRLRIDLAYDGGGFRGFARQPGQRTVQGVIEQALQRLCDEPVETVCAGRTDAGVHATAQTIHADVADGRRILRDLGRARSALDALCGPEIAVWQVRQVDATFDARFSARMRCYRYRLCDAEAMSPLWRHDTWHVGAPQLDVAAMDDGSQHLVGEHDFSAFCRRARPDQHLVRRIDRIAVARPEQGLVTVEVDGRAFCHQMVRSVAGLLLAVGRGRRRPTEVAEILAARSRQGVGQVAPPHGLTLVGVRFP